MSLAKDCEKVPLFVLPVTLIFNTIHMKISHRPTCNPSVSLKWGCFFSSPSIIFPPLSSPVTINASSTCHLECIKNVSCLGFQIESNTSRCQFIECGEEGKLSTSSSKDSVNFMWSLHMKDRGDPWLRYFGSSRWDEKTLTDSYFVQSTFEAAKEALQE
ncbi:hypothetical protein PRIPAC_71577 [Pristionchus pacificus]|uniref:Uncharacterized protein n=1 Tax=Pristionchus pacificus TaxID=54126 RepID=A0A2A6CGF9_PRIPA|nr:hypothetical protein PRIPAC_71577 [Pristionchus pacificus]|eukprot:PDM77153.1 hypothetical protein PRIPAC_43065 [Pristionchus pacificus]